MEMKNKPLSYLLHLKYPKGFSLPEFVVAMAVGLIALLVMSAFMVETGRLQTFISEQSEAIATGDAATTELAAALRETTDGDDGSFAIDTASDYHLTFFSDIDSDANTEKVDYQLTGTILYQTLTEPTGTPADYLVANGVTTVSATGIVNETYTGNPIFTYYDANNTILSEPIDLASVTLIKIHLDVNVDPNRVPDTHTIETYAQLRNLNDNL